MVPQKMLISEYISVLIFSGLITSSWVWFYHMSGMLCFLGNAVGIMGLFLSVNYSCRKGMEAKSIEFSRESVRAFLRNADKQHSRPGRKIPLLSRLRKWNPEVHTHLRPVARKSK